MKWLPNLENIAKGEQLGSCPYCKKNDIDYAYNRLGNSDMGYGAIWCNNCRRAFHISRIRIKDETHIKEIPTNLLF